ncbi:MAG: hypothetical protein K6G51_04095 [Sphaerochaetaceae bacterium]|nr:hypothetical protein [Sphaerochaetaceae bacterium]
MKRFLISCLILLLVSTAVFAGKNNFIGLIGADLEIGINKSKYDSSYEENITSLNLLLNGANYFGKSPFGIFYGVAIIESPIEAKNSENDNIKSSIYTIAEVQDLKFGISLKKKMSNNIYVIGNVGANVRFRNITFNNKNYRGYTFGVCAEPVFLVSLGESGRVNLKVSCNAYVPFAYDEKINGEKVYSNVLGFELGGRVGLAYLY